MVPVGDWAKDRLVNLSATDQMRDESKVGSGFGKRVANWIGRDLVYPTNVIHLATECGNRNHSAAFPIELPEWFIKLFTQPEDLILDPFMGSGTTALAAIQLGRTFTGIDINSEYITLAQERIVNTQMRLPAIAEKKIPYVIESVH